MKSSRDLRQEQCVKNWIKAKGHASIEAGTGFGKTRVGLLTASKLINKKPDFKILVVVPTTLLKEQWVQQLDSFGLSLNCNVQVINTIITKDWVCDLLIIDECHRYAGDSFSQIFEKVKYKLILGLTATFERLDGKHELVSKYCPICDSVPITECLANGWVSPYKEYLVLIDVDDIESYQKVTKEFNECLEFFNYDFNLMRSCTGQKGFLVCNDLRNIRCPKQYDFSTGNVINEEARKEMFKQIKFKSMRGMQLVQKRKVFINNHPKKIELARKIIEARPFSKIITFSNNVKMAESIGMGGKVYTGKVSKKKGRTTIEEFNKEITGLMHAVKKADEGMDIKGLSVGIVIGTDSGTTKARQRLGRIIRLEEGKQAEMFYIIINNSVELSWFQNSHSNQPYITIDEDGLEDVLAGKEPKPYKKKLKDFQFRF